ncbi:MAG: hypothetical protein R3C05_18715 [Pirellulaceae bacterium]
MNAAGEESFASEIDSDQVYYSRAVPSAAIAGTRLIEPAGGTRPTVDSNDGFNIEIVPGLNLRSQFGALAAVERAAAQWEAMLNDPITVTIQIDMQFEDVGDGFLVLDDLPPKSSVLPVPSKSNCPTRKFARRCRTMG